MKSVLLNLDNFESECLKKSTPYVLTSPTSLRACSKLLIEPNELVYTSLEKYEEDLAGLPLSEIYRIYDQNETQRQEKLIRCCKLRRTLQLKPAQELREKLVHLKRVPMKSESRSSRPDMEESPGPQKGERKSKKHVVLQYSSDTESFDGDYQPQHETTTSSTTATSLSNSRTSRTRSKSESSTKDTFKKISSDSSSKSQHGAQTSKICTSSSVPNLTNKKGNLNFQKVQPNLNGGFQHVCHRHYLCQCPELLPFTNDSILIDEYLKRYGYLLKAQSIPSLLTSDDQKILQLLLLKKGKAMEWEKRAQTLRRIIECERAECIRNRSLASQRLYERLAEKRRLENELNEARYLNLQRRDAEHRENLAKCLESRDRKVQNYLKQLAQQKNQQIYEKHRQEALKQLEVGKAIERLLEQDEEHRLALAENLEKRLTNAEIRKRRKEQDNWRHIYEMNRLDDEKRQLKHEQIERLTQNSIQQLRMQLEEKEARARLNYENQLKLRHSLPKDRGRKHEESIAKAQALHTQLLEGLEHWYKKIFELHLAAQRRASANYNAQISSRRSRLASERALREERSLERLRHVQEEEAKKRQAVKSTIESKESKSIRIQQDKEKRVQFSRRRAQIGAELRQQLRDKLDPDTFDKKVARVEVELRLLRQSGGGNYSRLKICGNNNNNNTHHIHQIRSHSCSGNGRQHNSISNSKYTFGHINGKDTTGLINTANPHFYCNNNNRNAPKQFLSPNYIKSAIHTQSCKCGCKCRSSSRKYC